MLGSFRRLIPSVGAPGRRSHPGGHLVLRERISGEIGGRRRHNRSMLLGREEEQRELERLLSEARSERSGVLAFVGEPGIGKSALLDFAAERGSDMRILRARGIESEAEVPFGGLLELIRPALAELERIPTPQAEALEGALALRPGHAQDRFAI